MVQVVYLDLRKVRIDEKACSLINVGPCACLAGEVTAVPGLQGALSTANFLHAQTYFACSNSTLKQMAWADSTGREYATYNPLQCGFGGSSAAVHLTSQSGNTCNEMLSRFLLCPMACRCAMCKSGSEAANLSVVAGDAHSLMYFTCRWLSRSRRIYRHSCCTTMSAWAHTCRWTSRGHLCRRHWRCSSPDPWLRRWAV